MDLAVDARSLISMSLVKLRRCSAQRGGAKLHRNLLLSCALRDARRLHVTERKRREEEEEAEAEMSTTVLDLDTHEVKTVDNRDFRRRCAADRKKRKPDAADATARRKRPKRDQEEEEEFEFSGSNISTLISVFGSGSSGLPGHPAGPEPALAGLGAWTRAVEAF